MKNRGAFMTDLDKMEIRDIPMPEPKEKEVLVELEYVGICGSDVHYFHDGKMRKLCSRWRLHAWT